MIVRSPLGLEEGSNMDDGHDEAMKAEWMERVISAATLANAHSFIMEMPQQYDTEVMTECPLQRQPV